MTQLRNIQSSACFWKDTVIIGGQPRCEGEGALERSQAVTPVLPQPVFSPSTKTHSGGKPGSDLCLPQATRNGWLKGRFNWKDPQMEELHHIQPLWLMGHSIYCQHRWLAALDLSNPWPHRDGVLLGLSLEPQHVPITPPGKAHASESLLSASEWKRTGQQPLTC